MTRYEELKSKQRAALIVVCTGGLAAVPIALNWRSNIFAGTSFDIGAFHFIFKVLSFLILTVFPILYCFSKNVGFSYVGLSAGAKSPHKARSQSTLMPNQRAASGCTNPPKPPQDAASPRERPWSPLRKTCSS